jgi:hypothetical protein
VNGLAVTRIPDLSWGEPKVCRAVGNDRDPWGVLVVLKETPWEALVPLVPSRVFDQALRGHATPLMRVVGPPPSALARRLPVLYAQCREREHCVNASPACVPGEKMPDCWEGDGIKPEAVGVASQVARLWREGMLVIVVVPEE